MNRNAKAFAGGAAGALTVLIGYLFDMPEEVAAALAALVCGVIVWLVPNAAQKTDTGKIDTGEIDLGQRNDGRMKSALPATLAAAVLALSLAACQQVERGIVAATAVSNAVYEGKVRAAAAGLDWQCRLSAERRAQFVRDIAQRQRAKGAISRAVPQDCDGDGRPDSDRDSASPSIQPEDVD